MVHRHVGHHRVGPVGVAALGQCVVAAKIELAADQLAEDAAVGKLRHLLRRRIVAVVLADGEDEAPLLSQRHDAARLRNGPGERLFHHHVLARLERLPHHRFMHADRHGDGDAVNRPRRERVLEPLVERAQRLAEPRREGLALFAHQFDEADRFDVGVEGQHVSRPIAAPAAEAHMHDAQLVQCPLQFLCREQWFRPAVGV